MFLAWEFSRRENIEMSQTTCQDFQYLVFSSGSLDIVLVFLLLHFLSLPCSHLPPWHSCPPGIHLENGTKKKITQRACNWDGYKSLTGSAATEPFTQQLQRDKRIGSERLKESKRRRACWHLLSAYAAMDESNRLSWEIITLTGCTGRADRDRCTGRERREHSVCIPSKSMLLRSLGLGSGSCTQLGGCWRRGGFCPWHSEQRRVASSGMWLYCFSFLQWRSTRNGEHNREQLRKDILCVVVLQPRSSNPKYLQV